jgi:hypothetical protein
MLLFVIIGLFGNITPRDKALLVEMYGQNGKELGWNWYKLEKGMVIKENYLILTGEKSYCQVEYKVLRLRLDNTFKEVDKHTGKQSEYTSLQTGMSGSQKNPRTIMYGKVTKIKGQVLFCPDRSKILKAYGSGNCTIMRSFGGKQKTWNHN